jgi:riboflavin transporter FmnP
MTDPVAQGPASIPPLVAAAVPVPSPAGFAPQAINYRGLTEQVTPTQVRAFRAQTKAAQRADPSVATGLRTATSVSTIVVLVVLAVFFVPIFLFVIFGIIAASVSDDGSSGVVGFLPFVIVIGGLITAITIAARHFTNGEWLKWLRLTQFAADNGLRFRTRDPNPSYSGMIFHIGDSRASFDHLNSTTGRYFDFGGFIYGTGSGKSRETHRWGYIALQLDRQLPNMVLDSKENNGIFGISNLPITFNKDQILSLEGDFNEHFTLYCPQEYETDALYVFTPDLMALLIDDANSFDVEIVDDWMFVYSKTPFDLLNATVVARLFTIIATVGAKTVTQTENYHDDRVGSLSSNIVAPQGQRLRHGFSLVGLIVIVLVVGGWLFGTVTSVIH